MASLSTGRPARSTSTRPASATPRSTSCVTITAPRAALELGQHAVQQARAGRVEARVGLVQQQQPRRVQQHAGQAQALGHARG